MARTVLVLGATSAIAHAYARLRAAQGATLVLAGRRREALEENAADLRARGAGRVEIVAVDLADIDNLEASLGVCLAFGYPDETLLAYGALTDQKRAEADIAYARAQIDTNFTSAALWLLGLAKARPAQRSATIAVIGSVAGDRGRGSNFVYGAAKGALERLVQGLQHAHAGAPARFVLIKPGFVDSPMTDAIEGKGGPLWAKPERVAADIAGAIDAGTPSIYTPWFWSFIMAAIRNMPRVVFDRLKI